MNQLRLFTVEDEHELVELLARQARAEIPSMAEEEQGDPPRAGSEDSEEWPRGGYWLRDWQDIVSEEVCVKRWGPI